MEVMWDCYHASDGTRWSSSANGNFYLGKVGDGTLTLRAATAIAGGSQIVGESTVWSISGTGETTYSPAANRKMYWRDPNIYLASLNDSYLDIVADGALRLGANVEVGADDRTIKFGTGLDASIYYDGTDLIVNPAVVGTGEFKVTGGSLELDSTEAVYLGDAGTDGTWRIIRSGNNLVIERREGGSYVTKSTIVA
jgi:hypothetical protein